MLIYENSLRFSMAIYGILALFAYLINNIWLVLVVGILMGMGAVSINYNTFYQLHLRFLRICRKPSIPMKDINKARFSGSIALIFLVLASILFYFWNLRSLAWILTGLVTILSLLAGLTGVCIGSIMYLSSKKSLRNPKVEKEFLPHEIGAKEYVNENCWLTRNLGVSPARRCSFRTMPFRKCPFVSYLVMTLFFILGSLVFYF